MKQKRIAVGVVESLCVNGEPAQEILLYIYGVNGDRHRGFHRPLNNHDSAYIGSSKLIKGDPVFNWRSWTGISREELIEMESELGVKIPQGCLLENITVTGIPNFSLLPPTSRLVFPLKKGGPGYKQAILAVWEENGPCDGVGKRLEERHHQPGLSARFIKAAQNKRGVMGFVMAAGRIEIGDIVEVYPPVL